MFDFSFISDFIMAHPFLFIVTVIALLISNIYAIYVAFSKWKGKDKK